MVTCTREIPKRAYDFATCLQPEKKCQHISGALEHVFANVSELYGYGVYGMKVYQEDGKYYVSYDKGSSCD